MKTIPDLQKELDEAHEERNRYIDNDCDGHDVNQRMRYMNELTEKIEDICDALDELAGY